MFTDEMILSPPPFILFHQSRTLTVLLTRIGCDHLKKLTFWSFVCILRVRPRIYINVRHAITPTLHFVLRSFQSELFSFTSRADGFLFFQMYRFGSSFILMEATAISYISIFFDIIRQFHVKIKESLNSLFHFKSCCFLFVDFAASLRVFSCLLDDMHFNRKAYWSAHQIETSIFRFFLLNAYIELKSSVINDMQSIYETKWACKISYTISLVWPAFIRAQTHTISINRTSFRNSNSK